MSATSATPGAYSRKNPFPAPLLARRAMSRAGSEKEVYHYEFSLEGSGFRYEPGDSIGAFGKNDPAQVEEILHLLGWAPDLAIPAAGEGTKPAREALLTDYLITDPSRQFLQLAAARSPEAAHLQELLAPERKKELDEYLYGRHIIDFLLEHPELRQGLEPEEVLPALRKLQPRLYSIASSQRVHPGEVHLLVDSVRYESHGRQRKGVCSIFFADRMAAGDTVPVFLHVAKGFRLPEDPDTPIIMVGPGTGIAPFRAFLEERGAAGARGRNWLFFGEQRRASDFYYAEEFEAWRQSGLLTRFDTAFSRDQADKIYVQHRLMEHARDIWAWLQEGACFYVCGDANRMAKDVDKALHEIARQCGGLDEEGAKAYIADLHHQKRYRRDVY